MRDVPKPVDEAFYSEKRTDDVPFSVNDSVEIVSGPHVGSVGAVISVESLQPEVTFLVELGPDGTDVIVSAASLRAI